MGLRIVSLLSGKALEAYTAMDEEKAHFYKDLKSQLARGFVWKIFIQIQEMFTLEKYLEKNPVTV